MSDTLIILGPFVEKVGSTWWFSLSTVGQQMVVTEVRKSRKFSATDILCNIMVIRLNKKIKFPLIVLLFFFNLTTICCHVMLSKMHQ